MASSIVTTILACLILGLAIGLTIAIWKYKKWKKYAILEGSFNTNKQTKKKFKIIIWTLAGILIALVIAAFIFSFTTTLI